MAAANAAAAIRPNARGPNANNNNPHPPPAANNHCRVEGSANNAEVPPADDAIVEAIIEIEAIDEVAPAEAIVEAPAMILPPIPPIQLMPPGEREVPPNNQSDWSQGRRISYRFIPN